ncbi:MAG: major capsid protein [Methylococcaceae bacterium]
MNVNIDFLNLNGQFQGELARQIMSNKFDPQLKRPWFDLNTGRSYVTVYQGHGDRMDPESYQSVPIQANATLRYDDWKQFDDAVLKASRTRLTGIQDLIDNGLTYSLGNGMGTMVLQGSTASDAMEAELSMSGKRKSPGDRINYEPTYLPLPIAHSDFELDSRVIEAARMNNHPIDTSSIEQGVRKVNEKLESMLFTNVTYAFGGGTIYSYLNEPNINTISFSTANWLTAIPAAVKNDVLALKQASINAKHYGTWMLYIPTAYEVLLDDDYDVTTPGKTIRQRILQIEGINGVKVVDTLPANTVVLAQMTSDVVRLVQGMPVQTLQWKTGDEFTNYFKVMAIQVPQVRSDQDGNSGVTVLS